jgi:hypothetical protein
MFALVAAVLLFLLGLGVLENSDDVDWFLVSLGFWALHFAVTIVLPWPTVVRREP